jgi:peptide/nickel transport system permease protein
MSEPVKTETATKAQSGVDVVGFASRRALVFRRFLRNKPAVVSLALLLVLFITCYSLPPLLPYSFSELDYYALQQPPSADHWFGTNGLGQDLFAQTLQGMQKSMLIGVCVAFISTIVAATVGSIAGYFSGSRDRVLMWIVDLLLVVPSFLLVMIVVQRTKGDIVWMIALLSIFSWMISSRVVRGMTLSLREREFVAAARYMGVRHYRIIVRHIVPNVASILIIDTALNIGVAIMAETGLSFLGFGVQPPEVSLGTLIADGTKSALTFPWLFLFPAAVLMLIVICANLIGDGLRDALDPSARQLRMDRR